MIDVRTKPTVAAGITKDVKGTAGIRLVEYQPGNGTRYWLSLVDLAGFPEVEKKLGCVAGTVVVTLLNWRGPAGVLLVGQDGFLHWSWVAEKMGLASSDAAVLAELLGHLLGKDAVSCASLHAERA